MITGKMYKLLTYLLGIHSILGQSPSNKLVLIKLKFIHDLFVFWFHNTMCYTYTKPKPWNHMYVFLCPRHSKNGGGALSVTPVHVCVRACVRLFFCPSIIKIWCPLNNFWKTASIQFKFGMLIYNIKTQAKFDLGYNPLIFDGVMGLL